MNFIVLEGADQSGELAQLLLRSDTTDSGHRLAAVSSIQPTIDLAEGEVLKSFCYGEPLAERGGFFVVHRDRPNLILRYALTWMS